MTEPGGELGVVARSRRQEFGEVTDQAGEFGQFGACGHQFPQQRAVGITQPAGAGEQEPGQAAGCDDRPIALGPALGQVAVQQVEAAGCGRAFNGVEGQIQTACAFQQPNAFV